MVGWRALPPCPCQARPATRRRSPALALSATPPLTAQNTAPTLGGNSFRSFFRCVCS